MFKKRTWIALTTLLAVLIAGAVYAALNLNRYLDENKEWIASRIESTLGRDVDFDSVGLSLRGGLGVRVDNLRIADDPSFSDLPFLTSDAIIVRVKLLPALFGRIEIARIVLDAPAVAVVRDGERLNTDSLAAAGSDTDASQSDSTESAAGILIAFLQIENGRVRYLDRTPQPASEVVVSQIDFKASDVSTVRPVQFSLEASALGAGEKNVTVSGSVGPLDPTQIDHTPIEIDAALSPIYVDSLRKLPALAAAIPNDLAVEGPLRLEASLTGALSEAKVLVELDATDARVALPASFQKERGIPLSARLEATRTADHVEVHSANLLLRDAQLTSNGTLTPGDPLRYDLSINSNRIELGGWEQIIPALAGISTSGSLTIAMRAGSVAGSDAPQLSGTMAVNDLAVRGGALPAISRLSSQLSIEKGTVRMPPSDFALGGSPARVEGTLTTSAPVQGTLRLTSPSLDAKSLGLAEASTNSTDRFEDLLLAVALSSPQQTPKITGDLETPSGTVAGAPYRNLRAHFRLERSRAVLNPLSLDVFDGSLKGEGVYDFSKADKPTFNFQVQAESIEVGKLLTSQLVGADRLLRGKLDGKISLAGSGSEWPVIRDGLVGGGRLDLSNGSIEDVNVAEEVLGSVTGIAGLSALLSPNLRGQYPQLFGTGQTTFDRLYGVVSIARGRIASEDVTINARDFLLFGRGSVGLDQSVDISATFEAGEALSQSLAKQVAAARYLANQSGRIQIPVRLTGTLAAMRAEPDMRFVQSALEKAVAGSLTDALLNKRPKGSAPPAGANEGEPPAPPPSPLEDVIRKGIGDLLGQ